MTVEHGLSELPRLIAKDVASKWQNASDKRSERRNNHLKGHKEIEGLWPRVRYNFLYKFDSAKNLVDAAALGFYLSMEDPFLAGVYTGMEKHIGHFAAAATATLSAYALNKAGTSLYQEKIMGEQKEDSQMPIDQVYLSAHLLRKIGIKPHNIETLVLGSYYGAEQEENDLVRQNAQRVARGQEPIKFDRKSIAAHHVNLFTGEYGALVGAAAILGDRFNPVDNAINTALQPKVMLPIYGLIYANRYMNKLRGKVRTGPTRSMMAYRRIVHYPAEFYNPNIAKDLKTYNDYSAMLDKLAGRDTLVPHTTQDLLINQKEGSFQGSEFSDAGDGVHFRDAEHEVIMPTKQGKETRMKRLFGPTPSEITPDQIPNMTDMKVKPRMRITPPKMPVNGSIAAQAEQKTVTFTHTDTS